MNFYNAIDMMTDRYAAGFKGKRIAFLTNSCAIDKNGMRSLDVLLAAGLIVTRLFSPEHGLNGAADAGAHVDDSVDAVTGLPCTSLYGRTADIPREQFRDFDVLLADMPDIGVRYYTYSDTLFHAMESCGKAGCPVWVLDRFNPLGSVRREGPVLDPAFASIVGRYPVPVRHGMTLGGYAQLAQACFGLAPECQLHVLTPSGDSSAMFCDMDFPWKNPSPNLRSFEAVCAYPGTCLFEGTNISEGRGTESPFLTIGAPFLDSERILEMVGNVRGAVLSSVSFTPDSNKFAGQSCQGIHISVNDCHEFSGFDTGFRLLEAIRSCHPRDFQFLEDCFFDKLVGSDCYRTTGKLQHRIS